VVVVVVVAVVVVVFVGPAAQRHILVSISTMRTTSVLIDIEPFVIEHHHLSGVIGQRAT